MCFGTETSAALFLFESLLSTLYPPYLCRFVGAGCDLGIPPVPHELGWLRTFCSYRSENFSFWGMVWLGSHCSEAPVTLPGWGLIWWWAEFNVQPCCKAITGTLRAGLILHNFKSLACHYMNFAWQVTSSLLISSDRLVISLFSNFFLHISDRDKWGISR